jgi:hypothetical protein
MNSFREHFSLLGFKVRDVVTGFEGVVESICLDLYGCVQAVVRAPVTEKGELVDGRWFDVKRLTALSAEPVMAVPAFEIIPATEIGGGVEKPAYPSNPLR